MSVHSTPLQLRNPSAVPQLNGRLSLLIVLIAKNAQRSGIKKKVLGLRDGKIDPASGEDAGEMAMCEEGDVPVHLTNLNDELIRAKGYLRGRFTPRGSIPKKIPLRMTGMHFRRSVALEVAVIPLRKVWVNHRRRLQPSKGAGLQCA